MTEPQPLTADVQPGTTIHRTVPGHEMTRVVDKVEVELQRDDDPESGEPVVYLVDLPGREGWAHDVLRPHVFHQWVVAE